MRNEVVFEPRVQMEDVQKGKTQTNDGVFATCSLRADKLRGLDKLSFKYKQNKTVRVVK